MPTSDIFNIPPVVIAVASFKPRSILDIGCGFGKYGVLLREYMDIANGRYARGTWQTRIVGLDGFADYRNPIWDAVYDEVQVGEARALLPAMGQFDVILIADVIEHFEKPAAVELVKQAAGMSRAVIISTPYVFNPQGSEFGNDFERHLCHWGAADTPAGLHCQVIPLLACDVFVISKDPVPKRQLYPTDWTDLLYLRSRRKFAKAGRLGWLAAATGRMVSRMVS